MSQKILFIKLLLVHYSAQTQSEVNANCHENVSLRCPGVDFDSMDFISVAWYKFVNLEKHGLIRRSRDSVRTQFYDFNRSISFGEKHSLLLQRATPEDSGTFECDIFANIGGQNQNLKVNLTVHACATQADLTTRPAVSNTTESGLLLHSHVEDLPVMWTVAVYVAVGLAKTVLSIISILVFRSLRWRSSNQRQHKW